MTKYTLVSISLAGVAVLGGGVFQVANAATNRTPETPAQAETNYENRLAKAVTAGKLTSAQETALVAEHKKLAAELTAATTKTEREAARKEVRTEAEAWAKTNNVKARWLLGHPHLRGYVHPSASPTPSS